MKYYLYIFVFTLTFSGCHIFNRQIIDHNCKTTIFGYLHSEYDITICIYPTSGSKDNIYCLNMKRDSIFSACLRPNTYRISDIIFNVQGFNDIAYQIPDLRFTVQPKVNNYIGDIYVDSKPAKKSIKLKTIRRGENTDDDESDFDYDYSSTKRLAGGIIFDIFVDEIFKAKRVKHNIRIIDSISDSQNVIKNLIFKN